MKWKWILLFVAVLFAGAGILYLLLNLKSPNVVSPVVNKILEKPLEKYTIENLGKREYKSEIFLDDPSTSSGQVYKVYKFHYDSDGKKVTGLAHIPNSCDKCPVIVQFRGYVDVEKYAPGVGTQKSAQIFSQNGFISLAPDFLGYGGSDAPSADVFEERFQSYTAALNLLAAIEAWPKSDGHIFIWGHSNGGQIALTVLEILPAGRQVPTVLWAPVSKPFPYSILYYTDEADDRGKALRKKLARFEQDYNVDLYDLTRYLDRINASIQLHQGTADEAVPVKWSRDLVKNLQALKKDVNYWEYPGADHNMVGSWGTVVTRDVEFFRKNL